MSECRTGTDNSKAAQSTSDQKAIGITRVIKQRTGPVVGDILVVGCGPGKEAVFLAQELNGNVIGIDLRTDFDPFAAKVVRLQWGDATALEFENDHFDLVFSYHVLEHVKNYRKALKEMGRVLKNRGYYCIGTPNRSRLIGYIGLDNVSLLAKVSGNLTDWKAKLMGRFRNEYGAHAGFTEDELANELFAVFGHVENITVPYYSEIYPPYVQYVKAIAHLGVGKFLFPSCYFFGRKVVS